ncbi:hypothetical protein MKW98_011177 [Papaver atlanticum]|uniref:Uncharacterized protein n=1 Tax=Papaver atlanticum TaxID=357466 RepID=A0AAD4TKB4_9MAGN|nr:hypothetical protein MKW98_011177 [Papaver atlanticum]
MKESFRKSFRWLKDRWKQVTGFSVGGCVIDDYGVGVDDCNEQTLGAQDTFPIHRYLPDGRISHTELQTTELKRRYEAGNVVDGSVHYIQSLCQLRKKDRGTLYHLC